MNASLAPVGQATVTSLATFGVNVVPPAAGKPVDPDDVTSQPMPVGTVLTRLPNTETIERCPAHR